MLAKTEEAAKHGEFEPFKTTSIFDSTAQNLAWLRKWGVITHMLRRNGSTAQIWLAEMVSANSHHRCLRGSRGRYR